jgi:hypothetical protein
VAVSARRAQRPCDRDERAGAGAIRKSVK